MYASSLDHLIELNQLDAIRIIMYGGFPDSPLNGGRFNYSLDGFFLYDRLFFRLTEKQLSKLRDTFDKTVTRANQNRIPFLIAYTNMFVGQDELNEENLKPVQRLVESGQKYGVKNGVILNNKLLEETLRQRYGEELLYVSSCTKYVSPDRILSPQETLRLYLADSGTYDYIVVTPQDSRREKLLKDVLRESKGEVIAICNSYCANACNSYHHYAFMSRENKKSLLDIRIQEVVAGAIRFIAPRVTTCSSIRHVFCKVNSKDIAKMQLKAGIVNFKLGRGLGDHSLDQLVSLILEFQKNPPPELP